MEMRMIDLQKEIHECAVEKGWWKEERNFGEMIALCHSELSEALEAWRHDERTQYVEDGKPEGWATELADCIIRILDMAYSHNVDMGETIRRKVRYNWDRPYRHGGLRA